MNHALAHLAYIASLSSVLVVSGALATLVPILADRSRHRPGSLAPIQLISGVGAWALLVLNAATLVNAVRQDFPLTACAALGTLSTAIYLFLRPDDRTVSSGSAPDEINALVTEIQQILSGTRRTGIERVTAIVVSEGAPFIGVSVSRRGHIVVRVRQDVASWLERHRRPGGAGAAAVESLLRFTFLQELGHVLDGDHLTYRFVRSVLVSHLWWPAAAIVAAILSSRDVTTASTVATCLCIAAAFLTQGLFARHLIAAREEVADLRAMQTLPPSDAALLLRRSGRGRGKSPTLLEKLMTDLVAQAPIQQRRIPLLSRVVRWIWPEGGDLRMRCELLTASAGGTTGKPIRWAAAMGVQCGIAAVALATAFTASATLPLVGHQTALGLTLVTFGVMCAMAATYCGMRADPALIDSTTCANCLCDEPSPPSSISRSPPRRCCCISSPPFPPLKLHCRMRLSLCCRIVRRSRRSGLSCGRRNRGSGA